MTTLERPGVLTSEQLRATAEHIASLQLRDGLIPWLGGHYADPWNHVEGAMALSVCGLVTEAERAFEWSRRTQAADGSWPMETVETADGGTEVAEASIDTNQVAYIAVGVWHHWLLTRDTAFVTRMWPVVRRAIELVVDLQLPSGAICWSRDAEGVVNEGSLLTGSSSIVSSLRCAMALAELVEEPQPDWELAAARLAHAVARHPEGFIDKSNFSMDWYYPVLGGAVTGQAGIDLIDARWDEFVVPGKGCRCVADKPWLTGAETCELAMALDAVGERERAIQLVRDIQYQRAEGGGYWTGWVFPEEQFWPGEQSSWTAAAVILAADALAEHSAASGLFRGETLPRLLAIEDCDTHCYALTGGKK
ncbi:hypothetical protein [Jatrophihabitans sp.]|uniref:hypothetical protein n=1 Tax=Jatrophihabitans sp. TaxID=1932789 RepID=UPI0030C65FC6|nr:hypothetical protein [Jatrophihabitans sp.]